jgi:chromosome partitioning protein
MERGAPHLASMIREGIDTRLKALAAMGASRKMHVPDTKLAGVVVTRIQTHGPAYSGYIDDHTTHLASLQRQWKKMLLAPYIEQGTGVSQSLSAGVPVYDRGDTQNIGARGINTMYEQLTSVLKKKLDTI